MSFPPFILPRLTVVSSFADAAVQSVVEPCNIALYLHSQNTYLHSISVVMFCTLLSPPWVWVLCALVKYVCFCVIRAGVIKGCFLLYWDCISTLLHILYVRDWRERLITQRTRVIPRNPNVPLSGGVCSVCGTAVKCWTWAYVLSIYIYSYLYIYIYIYTVYYIQRCQVTNKVAKYKYFTLFK